MIPAALTLSGIGTSAMVSPSLPHTNEYMVFFERATLAISGEMKHSRVILLDIVEVGLRKMLLSREGMCRDILLFREMRRLGPSYDVASANQYRSID
jgi:hypothetical protein